MKEILENYRPVPVKDQLRWTLKKRLKNSKDPFPGIDGREDVKREVAACILSGSHIYLVSQEGTGKTRMAKEIALLLPPVFAIKGCPFHDDPLWPRDMLCPRCRASEDPIKEFGIEVVPGIKRFSRIQGNEYVNEAKLIGFKDIQAIAGGKSPKDPLVFVGTGIPRGNRGIVFIDELPAIRTKVQVLLHPLLEEGKLILEEYGQQMNMDTLLVATGNPEGFSHVNEIPRPLLDRLELIPMPMPDEDTEKTIAMGVNGRPENTNQEGIPPLIEPPERDVKMPWWIADILIKAVRGSRECPRLEKKASIRASIKAITHTESFAELSGRSVPNIEDALSGLKLSLRGRVSLKPEYIDFENPERSMKKLDRISEDLLAMAIWEEGEAISRIYPGFKEEIEIISEEFRIMGERPWDIGSLPPFTSKFVKWMIGMEEDVKEKNQQDYVSSAVDFLANILYRGGKLSEGIKGLFHIPRLYKEKDL